MAFVLQVDIRIKPENVKAFMAGIEENAAASRRESGCRQFDIDVDPNDEAHLLLYEVYDDEATFERHQQTAHFKKYLAQAVPLLAARQRHIWKRVSG